MKGEKLTGSKRELGCLLKHPLISQFVHWHATFTQLLLSVKELSFGRFDPTPNPITKVVTELRAN